MQTNKHIRTDIHTHTQTHTHTHTHTYIYIHIYNFKKDGERSTGSIPANAIIRFNIDMLSMDNTAIPAPNKCPVHEVYDDSYDETDTEDDAKCSEQEIKYINKMKTKVCFYCMKMQKYIYLQLNHAQLTFFV